MSKIEIEFASLKYNLYEILNVSPDSDETKIKKSFMKLVKSFHPDKNSELEEDIYYHIILSNQILLNKESRKKYDSYLCDRSDTFIDLKNTFNKNFTNPEKYYPSKDDSIIKFNNKITELNKKHCFNTDDNQISVLEQFEKAKQKRSTDEIKIIKEAIKDENDFNHKFESKKIDGKFQDQIIEYKDQPGAISTYVMGEHYTSLIDMDKLYIEDSIQSNKYSSLDRAFSLCPIINSNDNNKSLEEKINDYQKQSDTFVKMVPTDYSNKKFNEWCN